jgi:hypothetical protein
MAPLDRRLRDGHVTGDRGSATSYVWYGVPTLLAGVVTLGSSDSKLVAAIGVLIALVGTSLLTAGLILNKLAPWLGDD